MSNTIEKKNKTFYNFRDISIFPNLHSKNCKLRPGLIFRSSSLSKYDASLVLRFLNKNKIRYILDLRADWEKIKTEGEIFRPYDKEILEKFVVNIPIDPKKVKTYLNTNIRYQNLYFAILKDFHIQITRIFRDFFSNAPKNKLIVHCEAGKDRTGIIIALLYNTLGIEREIIIKDYLHSLHDTKRELIEFLLKVIEEEYGGAGNFLLKQCNISKNELELMKKTLVK